MSRVFTRGGGRGGGGNSGGNPANVNNSSSGVNRSRGSTVNANSNREWRDQDSAELRDSDIRSSPSISSNPSFSSLPPSQQCPAPTQQQQPAQQQQQPGNQQQQQQHHGGQRQPTRPVYTAKPRGNSDKSRGGSSGEFGAFQQQNQQPLHQQQLHQQQQQQQHQQGGPNRDNRNRENTGGRNNQSAGGGQPKQQSAPRDNGRDKRNNPPGQVNQNTGSTTGMLEQQQQSQRGFDQHSSRETSSIDTQENDENTLQMAPARSMGGDDVRENHPPSFVKPVPGNQANSSGRRDHKPEVMQRSNDKRERDHPENLSKGRLEQNRQGVNLHQNSFDHSFGKTALEDVDRESDNLGFGGFKNGHMGRMMQGTHLFEEPISMYGPKQRYFPMGDMGHADKGMGERGFDQSSHDGGDIFSGKDVFWRGADREEKRDSFLRDDSSPTTLAGKSMIWSNQTAAGSIHSQSESPHFPPQLGFNMDPSAFAAGLLTSGPGSMIDRHMDPMNIHQRMMHQSIPNMPLNQFLANPSLGPDRMHPGGMSDRLPTMFSQPPAMPQMMGPMRMQAFHPHPQFAAENFISPQLARDPPSRVPQQQQQQAQVTQQPQPSTTPQSNSFAVAPAVAAALNMGSSPSPRSPHASLQDKNNWTWEEQHAGPEESECPPSVKEPLEDFGEFKCPALNGSKTFDNLCKLVEELVQFLQENMTQLIQTPHKERLRRVMVICFNLWSTVREAILMDGMQACDKSRELDQVVWRDGFYPVYDLLRTLIAKPTQKHEALSLNEAVKVFLHRALGFYNDLIPKVLHPFGGSMTPQALVGAMAGKPPMADHILISLQLAQRLLVHLGDLYRYQAEMPGSDGSELNQAREAYDKACLVSPFNGLPHGRLALVAKRRNRPLDVAFYSIRAISVRIIYPQAKANLAGLWAQVEKTYEKQYPTEDKAPIWSELAYPELVRRFNLTFLAVHASFHRTSTVSSTLHTLGTQFLALLDAVLNHPLSMGSRVTLLQMIAINIYGLSTLTAESTRSFLMDLSFNFFDIVLARMLRNFENAPDLDSAVYLEDTAFLSPAIKVFVEWMQSTYQQWFPLPTSQLSAPRDTKRTSMWSRIVSLVNLSLTLNVAGVAQERFQDSVPGNLYEDLFLAGMSQVQPTLTIFYRETKLHETIAEPRFRFRKLQALGPVLLSVNTPVARLQWNRFLPTTMFEDKNVKVLWAPLEPPPIQRVEPLPVLESRPQPVIPQAMPMPIPLPADRAEPVRQWRPAQTPASDPTEQNWPSLGQAKIATEERRERVRTASTNSGGTEDSRNGRNGEPTGITDSMRSNVEPWWLIDKRLRTEAGSHTKLNGPEPVERKPARLEQSSKQYYLIDTNCMIDHLERIEKKLLDNDDLVILIPAIVYRELWKLHEKKNLKAHAALSFISDGMEHSKGRILVITAKGDTIQHSQLARREVVTERGNNDDIIIRTCSTLAEKGLINEDDKDRRPVEFATWRGSLVLLTSDINMRVKARKENVCCRLVSDVLPM